MTAGSPALCRVSIQLGAIAMDVALPTEVPLGVLLPSLCEIAARHGVIHRSQAGSSPRYLSIPGLPALDSSKSLSEMAIRDGTVLMLSEYDVPAPAIRAHHDAAEVLATTGAVWTPEFSRLAGLLTAVALTTVSTFLVVPGSSAAPRLLLSAAATAMVCVIAASFTDHGGRTLTVIALIGGFICATALPATVFAVPIARTGVGLVVVSIIVLSVAGRVSVKLSGLGPRSPDLVVNLGPDAEDKARCARQWLSCLTSAGAVCAALAVAIAVGGAPPTWPICALAAAVTAVLLLRARTLREPVARTCLLAAGITSCATLLVAVRQLAPLAPVWICLIALGSIIFALWLGERGFRKPHTIRGAATAEVLAQAMVVPLAAWAFGLYTSARGFGPL